jgi:ectoine hydroxylase-related dioxygenase (phytanoyl-CoA dioxygenase family)
MMGNYPLIQADLSNKGFAVISNVYTAEEVNGLKKLLTEAVNDKPIFRKTKDLFAIRQCLKEISAIQRILFNGILQDIIENVAGSNYFVVKSIYFDKPPESNWFVAWHQDLTISVSSRVDVEGFGPWTVKQDQFAVQPPVEILQNNLTVRIHLDDTNELNGALKVIPGSHLKGILRNEEINKNDAVSVNVPAGGIMLMKPLLMHSSSRTINNAQRRVLHIEFSNQQLPEPLEWSEYLNWRS